MMKTRNEENVSERENRKATDRENKMKTRNEETVCERENRKATDREN